MPDRDKDISKFSFLAYRKLKKTLGEFDAIVECNEIAIKEFIEAASKQDLQKYIERLSTKHSVKVNEVNFLKFSSRIRQYYVASVSQQFEQFLKEFRKEWTEYNPNHYWIEPPKGQTIFQNILKNTGINLPNDLIEILEYYRIVRNYMAHTDRDKVELKSRIESIKSNSNEFLKNFHLDVLPNKVDEIDFNDFLILTNIVKHIAFILSTNSKPENYDIASILVNKMKENGGNAFKGIKKLKNNNHRYEKAIKNYITTTFGRFNSEDLEFTYKEIKSLLA